MLCMAPPDEAEREPARPPSLATVLFGLSLATVLPPSTMPLTPGAIRPVRQPDARIILTAMEIATLLNRPTATIWRGRIALGELDGRLRGLESLLHVIQVTDGSGVLICLGVVQPAPRAAGEAVATPYDLWALACDGLVRQKVPHERRIDIGQDALLAIHGGMTAQAAWLIGDRLTTASVTSLAGDMDWTIEAARSIATHLTGGRG